MDPQTLFHCGIAGTRPDAAKMKPTAAEFVRIEEKLPRGLLPLPRFPCRFRRARLNSIVHSQGFEEPCSSVSMTKRSASCHDGMRTPNTSSIRSQERRELAGRLAGRGNSLVGMGTRRGMGAPVAAAWARRALANPNQVVAPEQVTL
jgi:hypothetical protein